MNFLTRLISSARLILLPTIDMENFVNAQFFFFFGIFASFWGCAELRNHKIEIVFVNRTHFKNIKNDIGSNPIE